MRNENSMSSLLAILILIVKIPIQMIRYYSRYILNNVFKGQRELSSQTGNGKQPFLMIASIGNPEPEFSGSRHNVGHIALDKLVENHWTHFKQFGKHRNITRGVYSVSETDKLQNVLLYKSNETFMNLQGEPVFKNWRQVKRIQEVKYDPALVVLHDEIQLPLGKIQIRRQGTSARGHNGLRSLDSIMGKNYTKISIGVGKPPNQYVADYVLAKFKRPEMEILTYDVMPQVVEALEEMVSGKYVFDKV